MVSLRSPYLYYVTRVCKSISLRYVYCSSYLKKMTECRIFIFFFTVRASHIELFPALLESTVD